MLFRKIIVFYSQYIQYIPLVTIPAEDHDLLYRVSTKELYTLKMIQKTNAAYLELHTYTTR
jgi:hypothetical protein